MSAESDGVGHKQIDLKCCPVCSVPVSFSFRYSNAANSTTKILDAIKLEFNKPESSKVYRTARFKPSWRSQDLLFGPPRIRRMKNQIFFRTTIELLGLINRTIDQVKKVWKTQAIFFSHDPMKALPKEINNRLKQLLNVCTAMEDGLIDSQPDVTSMVKVSQVAIIVSVLVDVLEVKVKESKTLTTSADDTLNEITNATEVHGAFHVHAPYVDLYLFKQNYLISIGNQMNAGAFRDLWMRVLFSSSQNCTSRWRMPLENFKTSQATINQEMHEQVHAIFCLLYSQQLQNFIELFVLIIFNFLVDIPFCRPVLPNFQPGLCCF